MHETKKQSEAGNEQLLFAIFGWGLYRITEVVEIRHHRRFISTALQYPTKARLETKERKKLSIHRR